VVHAITWRSLPNNGVHPDNGIWLCQNCAKLVDNDTLQFPEEVLRAWKTIAEHRARLTIGRTVPLVPMALPLQPESGSQRKLRTLLLWKGRVVTLSQMTTGRAVMMIGPKAGSSLVQVLDCTEHYVTVGVAGDTGWSRSISLENISISFDDAKKQLEIQERY
jgi:hypothetical protein